MSVIFAAASDRLPVVGIFRTSVKKAIIRDNVLLMSHRKMNET